MRPLVMSLLVAAALSLCHATKAAPVSDLDVLRQGAGDESFAQADSPRAFHFPADHGPHPDFRHEWWYVTGNLDGEGHRYGFELTFFRLALAPGAGSATAPAAPATGPATTAPVRAPATTAPVATNAPVAALSRWRARQIYAAHFAVTDVTRGQFRYAQKFSREALGLAGAAADPLRVWIDDWQIAARDASRWQLHAAGADYELTLTLRVMQQPVLNGEQGLSRKAAETGAASYYYSMPRLEVSGTLLHAGHSTPVSGLAWLDREWGSGSLGRGQRGWDWFALQLDDGSALMFYSLRGADGIPDPHSAGTWVEPSGQSRALGSQDVRVEVLDRWTSPRGGRYPARWRLVVPSLGLDLEARPVLPDQELGTRPRYWEGAVDLRGRRASRAVSGRGYVELVGYGE